MSTLCTLDLSSSLSPLLLLEVIEKKKCFSVSNTYVFVFGFSDLRRWNVFWFYYLGQKNLDLMVDSEFQFLVFLKNLMVFKF